VTRLALDPPAQLLDLPTDASLDDVAAAARSCRNCPLYRHATMTVFGEGPAPAPMMLVGEQPGDPRTARVVPSSVRRARSSTGPWPMPASIAAAPT
jgi:hypothetical protein